MITRKYITLVLLSTSMGSFNGYSAEGDTYDFSWLDPDKEVYVLQNRKYRKKGKLFFSVGGGVTTSGAFVDNYPLQARAGYFAREVIGFEFIYSRGNGKENQTAKDVRNVGVSGSHPFRRIVQNYMGGMFIWSPFYSKINTFNKILYADWTFGIGYGALEEKNNRRQVLRTGSPSQRGDVTENHNGILWTFGTKWYLSEMFDIRADLTTFHYQANKPARTAEKKIWYSNWDVTWSLGVRF